MRNRDLPEVHLPTGRISPEDVRDVRFYVHRLRAGYDLGQVDDFLDAVEAELVELRADVEHLRARLVQYEPGVLFY